MAGQVELLLVDEDPNTKQLADMLRATFRVATMASVQQAKQYLKRDPPHLIVTELKLRDGSGVDICRDAKAVATPPSVLVTTADVERVPEVLTAGCDGVLLKPFAPNLLRARIGRLLRGRSEMLRERARHTHLKALHLSERSELLLGGTNRMWPNTHCPYCAHGGVTSFEFASHRRAWYACLECSKVWIAKRQE